MRRFALIILYNLVWKADYLYRQTGYDCKDADSADECRVGQYDLRQLQFEKHRGHPVQIPIPEGIYGSYCNEASLLKRMKASDA